MDTNYIKKDGFSNPDTERFFKKHWNGDLMEATCRARKHCGVCFCAFIFVDSVEDNLWLLCTHEDSPNEEVCMTSGKSGTGTHGETTPGRGTSRAGSFGRAMSEIEPRRLSESDPGLKGRGESGA
jgi:hypothetical protein